MHLIEHVIHLFVEEPLQTEQRAYQLLRSRPLQSEIPYLAAPWSVLINKGRLNLTDFPNCEGGMTVCQHVLFPSIIPILNQIGITTLFAAHADNRAYEMTVRPFPLLACHGVPPRQEKDILCSFIGFDSCKSIGSRLRRSIFQLPRPESVIVKRRSAWHWRQHKWWQFSSKRDPQAERREYEDVLARSRFSLCPRGAGPNTLRLWESMQAGAIPVLLADSLQLPGGIAWEEFLIRVEEHRVDDVYDIIQSISPAREEAMRQKCLLAYAEFSGDSFVNTIRRHFHETV